MRRSTVEAGLSQVAKQWIDRRIEPPAHEGHIRVCRATVKSGRALAYRHVTMHYVEAAAFVIGHTDVVLATRWMCGGGSVNATAVSRPNPYPLCRNCAEASRYPTGPVVYRAYDVNDALLYIGSTIHFGIRLRSHRWNTGWWSEVSRLDVTSHATEVEARIAEAVAIVEEGPQHNRVGVIRDRGAAS